MLLLVASKFALFPGLCAWLCSLGSQDLLPLASKWDGTSTQHIKCPLQQMLRDWSNYPDKLIICSLPVHILSSLHQQLLATTHDFCRICAHPCALHIS